LSWRQEAVDRLEAFCGLNPQALGKGPVKGGEYWVNHHKENTMHFCKATIALGEDMRNTVNRDETSPISWPEVEIVRLLHGDAAVTDIIPFVQVSQSPRAERQRLAEIYGDQACKDAWGGRAGPGEMEAPEATLKAGVTWVNPITRMVEVTSPGGGTTRPETIEEETDLETPPFDDPAVVDVEDAPVKTMAKKR
jgi:hypothetical protein